MIKYKSGEFQKIWHRNCKILNKLCYLLLPVFIQLANMFEAISRHCGSPLWHATDMAICWLCLATKPSHFHITLLLLHFPSNPLKLATNVCVCVCVWYIWWKICQHKWLEERQSGAITWWGRNKWEKKADSFNQLSESFFFYLIFFGGFFLFFYFKNEH